MGQSMPPEIVELQRKIEQLLQEHSSTLVTTPTEEHYDPDDYAPTDGLLVLSGWIVGVEWTDVKNDGDDGSGSDTWSSSLGSRGSTRAQRVGLARLAEQGFSGG